MQLELWLYICVLHKDIYIYHTYILYLYTMFLYPNHFPNKYMSILSERSSFNTTPSSIFETPIVPWPMAMANGYVTPAVSQRGATSKVRTSGLWGFDLCDSFYLLMFEKESGKDWNDISCQGVCERFPSYLLQRPDSLSFRQVSHFHLLGQHSTFYRFYQSFGTQIRRLQPDFALQSFTKSAQSHTIMAWKKAMLEWKFVKSLSWRKESQSPSAWRWRHGADPNHAKC